MAEGTATSAHTLHLKVITPARSVLDANATSIVVPAFDGELGVLPGHADLLALLGPGVLRLTTPEGQHAAPGDPRRIFAGQSATRSTILTPESASQTELKPEALKAEHDKLHAEKPTKLEEREVLENKLIWLKARERASQPAGSAH